MVKVTRLGRVGFARAGSIPAVCKTFSCKVHDFPETKRMATLQVIERFTKPDLAVTHTLKTAAGVSHLASEKTYRRLASGFSLNASPKTQRQLVVFDIDDTLLNDHSAPLKETIQLLKRLRQLNARVFLVTARHPSTRNETVEELKSIGVYPDKDYDELLITPIHARVSMKHVGDWKKAARQSIANKFQMPILLTVGDQWTDIVPVESERELYSLDAAFGTRYTPWVLLRISDGIGVLGLKLRAT